MVADADDTETHEAATRAARREFVRRHHPDHGGDVQTFVDGLASFDRALPRRSPRPNPTPVTVFRTRSVRRTLLRAVRETRRRIEKRPARRLL